jgi:hypothetical protein
MPYQNANSGGSALAIIWLVAMIILFAIICGYRNLSFWRQNKKQSYGGAGQSLLAG